MNVKVLLISCCGILTPGIIEVNAKERRLRFDEPWIMKNIVFSKK